MTFNPDEYLGEQSTASTPAFNPDQYLSAETPGAAVPNKKAETPDHFNPDEYIKTTEEDPKRSWMGSSGEYAKHFLRSSIDFVATQLKGTGELLDAQGKAQQKEGSMTSEPSLMDDIESELFSNLGWGLKKAAPVAKAAADHVLVAEDVQKSVGGRVIDFGVGTAGTIGASFVNPVAGVAAVSNIVGEDMAARAEEAGHPPEVVEESRAVGKSIGALFAVLPVHRITDLLKGANLNPYVAKVAAGLTVELKNPDARKQLANLAIEGLKTSAVFGATGAAQKMTENEAIRQLIDPGQTILEGVPEAAVGSAIVAMPLGMLAAARSRRTVSRDINPKQAQEPLPPEELADAGTTQPPAPSGTRTMAARPAEETFMQNAQEAGIDVAPAPAAAAVAATPAPEPQLIPQEEASLFATDPQTPTTSALSPSQYPVTEMPVKEITLSKDVPNFKEDADPQTGVVRGQQLEGKYQRLGTGPIVVWERANGDKEVISGRHRLDLARRAGEKTIPSQVVREADGFTKQKALILDAELNIRDGQGTVNDYARYFKDAPLTEQEARARGLLARPQGNSGWNLGRNAGDNLYALFQAGKIPEQKAVAIAQAAPGDPDLQRVGIQAAGEDASGPEIIGRIEAAKHSAAKLGKAAQGDFFANTELEKTWKEQGRFVARKRNELSQIISTRKAIVNKYDAATGTGSISAKLDTAKQELEAAQAEQERWSQWASHADLRHQVETLGKAPAVEADELQVAERSAASTVPVAKLDAPQFTAKTFGLSRAMARSWALKNLASSYVNGETGWLIEIGRNGIDKALSGQRAFPHIHLEAIRALPELLKNAALYRTAPDRDGNPQIKAIHVFYAPLQAGDNLYRVKLTIKEVEGKRFYDHSLVEMERPAGIVAGVTPEGASHQTSTAGPFVVKVSDLFPPVNPQSPGNTVAEVTQWARGARRPIEFHGKPEQLHDEAAAAIDSLGAQPLASTSGPISTRARGFDMQLASQRRALAAQLKTVDGMEFIGQKIRSEHDLAMLAQVFRNPLFETARLVFLKGDEIVYTYGVTSRMPTTAQITISGKLEEIRHAMKMVDADGFYLLHNHPSGEVEPSGADIRVTQRVNKEYPGQFRGHVVIDGGKYSFITPEGSADVRTFETGPDALLTPDLPHPMIGTPAFSKRFYEQVAQIANKGRAVKNPDMTVTLLGISSDAKIRMIADYDAREFLNTEKALTRLRAQGKANGLAGMIAYYDGNNDLVLAQMKQLTLAGVLQSGLYTERESGQSLRLGETRHEVTEPGYASKWMGVNLRNDTHHAMVAEETGLTNAAVDIADAPLELLDSKGNPYARVPLAGLKEIKIVQMPELVELTRELTGQLPLLKKFQSARGMFYSKGQGRIALDPRIFADPVAAAKTLAHEIGHLIDYLPDATMKRGNLLGRLHTLRNFLKNNFGFGTVSNKEVRAELVALTKYWKPYDPAKHPKWYVQYRESAVELYADAVSVLFNSPATLKKMAPKFWDEFFRALDAKQEVKDEFFELQRRLHQPMRENLRARQEKINAAFATAEEIYLTKVAEQEARHKTWQGLLDRIKQEHFDIYYPLIKKQQQLIAQGKTVRPKDRVDWLFGEHPMADNHTYRFLQKTWADVVQPIEALDMTKEDLGRLLMLKRIRDEQYSVTKKAEDGLEIEQHGRRVIANPGGLTPDNARLQLLEMRVSLGAPRFEALERAAAKYHDQVFDVMRAAADAGLFSQKVFNEIIKPNKQTYAAFVPLKYVDRYVPSGIYKQGGTLEDIANPFTSTTLKTITLFRAIQHQRAVAGAVNFLLKYYPAEVKLAEVRNERPVKPRDPAKALLEIKVDGKIVGYEVPAEIASIFEDVTSAHAESITRIIQTTFAHVFYPLIIRYNPVFQLFMSPMRDFHRMMINAPTGKTGAVAREWLVEFGKALANSDDSAARARLDGRQHPLIAEMHDIMALGTPFDSFARSATLEDGFDQVLKKFHLVPDEEKAGWWHQNVGQHIMKLGQRIEYAGQVFESLPKISTYKVLTRELGYHPREAAEYVRNHVGVPNYLKKGKWSRIVQAWFPFYTVFINGYESDYRLATGKVRGKSAASWWFKWAAFGGAAMVLQALAESGVLGDELKKMFNRASEYDKTNYLILPVGSMAGGDFGEKTVYLRFPQDETSRLMNGLLYKAITSAAKAMQGQPQHGPSELFAVGSGYVPGIAPLLEIASGWRDYMAGHNPIDNFRGNFVLSNSEYLAGGWDAHKAMLSWTADQTGVTNFIRWNEKAETTTELTLSAIPVVNRLLKISDAGLYQQQTSDDREQSAENARLRLGLTSRVQQLAQEYNHLKRLSADARTPQQAQRYAVLSQWNRTLYSPITERMRAYNDAKVKGAIKPLAEALDSASSPFEKK